MKKKIFLVIAVLLLMFSFMVSVYAMGVTCPRCEMDNCIWTGNVSTDAWGMYNEYRCVNGHLFWIKCN